MKLLPLSSFLPLIFAAAAAHAQIHAQAGDVEDKRSTDNFFSGLDVQVKFMGDSLANAQSIRASVKTAVDDTGRDLVNPKKESNKFEKIDGDSGNGAKIELKLKSPTRKAQEIKEITGEVELYSPQADPDATVRVDEFQKAGGKPIAAPALQAAGIEVTTYTKEQADAMKARKQAEAKKHSKSNIGEALADAFGEMFNMGGGPNSLLMQVKDPNGKVVDIQFEDASGKKVETEGSSSSTDGDTMTKTCDFESKLPDSTRLVIHVMTPKTMVKVPFSLENVFLP